MLNRDSLPPATQRVFDHLAQNTKLAKFTLIGGSALALQIAHRYSEDLDFWLPARELDKNRVSEIVREAQNAGFAAVMATPADSIVAARINGIDILAYAQDYVIGGVKVTFFARHDTAYQYFDTLPRTNDTPCAFRIMGVEGLFAMKSYVIHERVRSRDLFDLKAFLSRDKTLTDIFRAGMAANPTYSAEYAKSVLIGAVPLDRQDEGFSAIGVTESIENIHRFFKAEVDAYEQSFAEAALRAALSQ